MKRIEGHPRAEELLVERALRPLDAGEHAELAGLGAEDDESFEIAAAAIALAATPIEPMPADLAERILAAAPAAALAADFRRTLPGVVAPAPVAAPAGAPAPVTDLAERRARRRRTVLPWLAAAACLLVAGGAVWIAWRARQGQPTVAAAGATSPEQARQQLVTGAPDVAKLAWSPTQDPTARAASGDVVWSTAQQRGYMRFVGLAPNDPHQFQYQLWIFDKDRDERFPVDGGVFDVTSTGEVIVPINPKLHVTDATLFAVTVERPGGVVVSKRERIVVTATRT